MFHQLLEHRWFMSQQQNRDVPLSEALNSYINDILRHRRDEATVVGPPTGTITMPIEVQAGAVADDDWRLTV